MSPLLILLLIVAFWPLAGSANNRSSSRSTAKPTTSSKSKCAGDFGGSRSRNLSRHSEGPEVIRSRSVSVSANRRDHKLTADTGSGTFEAVSKKGGKINDVSGRLRLAVSDKVAVCVHKLGGVKVELKTGGESVSHSGDADNRYEAGAHETPSYELTVKKRSGTIEIYFFDSDEVEPPEEFVRATKSDRWA